MKSPIVQVESLVKEFDGFRAVDDLNLEMARGEVLGVLGANGAGKTTLMNMMLGLTTPTSGFITIFGKSIAKERIAILQKTNFSSAYTALPGNLKVEENLIVFGHLYRLRNVRQRVQEVLEMFEAEDLRKRKTGHLSAGESTRINLCKAFLNAPQLLLLDEPTASLDPDIADKVRKLIRRVQREAHISILYTSHNMRDIEEVCDRVVFMDKGKIIREGTPQEVKDAFAEDSLENVFIRIARGGDLVETKEEKA